MDLEQQIMECDDLPAAVRPALAFTTLALVAEEAARAGLDERDAGRAVHARGAVEKHVEGLRPPPGLDTLDAWARRGGVHGIITAWGTLDGQSPIYKPPVPCPSSMHAVLHWTAWYVAGSAVMEVRGE